MGRVPCWCMAAYYLAESRWTQPDWEIGRPLKPSKRWREWPGSLLWTLRTTMGHTERRFWGDLPVHVAGAHPKGRRLRAGDVGPYVVAFMDQGPIERRSLLAFDLQGKGVTVNANQSSQWEQPTRLVINNESSVRVPNKPEIVISSELGGSPKVSAELSEIIGQGKAADHERNYVTNAAGDPV